MNHEDAVTSVGDSIAQLDTLLGSGDPPINSTQWQRLEVERQQLDAKQKALLHQQIQADDQTFQTAAAPLKAATTDLNDAIAKGKSVDTILTVAGEVASAADTLLKLK
jgi:hypothetical protein